MGLQPECFSHRGAGTGVLTIEHLDHNYQNAVTFKVSIAQLAKTSTL